MADIYFTGKNGFKTALPNFEVRVFDNAKDISKRVYDAGDADLIAHFLDAFMLLRAQIE